jgi:hypothetical protein
MNARFKKIASSIASLLAGATILAAGAADAAAQEFDYTYGGEECIEAGRGGVQPVRDGGGYVAAGETFSNTACETSDIYVIRTNNDGSRAWSISYDLGGNDSATDILEVVNDPEGNGGFIITGVTEQLRQQECRPSRDVFLLRIDRCGFVIWMKTYGHESSDEIGWDVVEAQTGNERYRTAPGDFIVAGSTTIKANCRHGYLLRVTSRGDLIWDALYETGLDDYFYALDECLNNINERTGDIVAAGGTNGYSGNYDAWVVRVNGDNGQFTAGLHNAAAYGREGFEEFRSIQELKYNDKYAGDLVLTGQTNSGLSNSEVYLLQTSPHPCEPRADETMGDLGRLPDEGYCIRELPFDVNDEARRGDLVVTGYVSALAEAGGHGGKDVFLQVYRPLWNQLGPYTMTYGGRGTDWGWSVAPVEKEECRSAGFIIAGFTNSPDLVAPWDPQQLYLIKTNERRDDRCTAQEFPVQEWSPKFEPRCAQPKVGKIVRQCEVSPELRCQFWERQYCLNMDVPFCQVEPCECGQQGKNIEKGEGGDAGSEKLSTMTGTAVTATTDFAVRSFPNPVKRGSDLNVEYMLSAGSEVTITITDMSGRVIHTVTATSEAGVRMATVSTREWASGAYMVNVTAGGKSMTRRVVVTD